MNDFNYQKGDRVVILSTRKVTTIERVCDDDDNALYPILLDTNPRVWARLSEIETVPVYLSKLKDEVKKLEKIETTTPPPLQFEPGDKVIDERDMGKIRTVIYADRNAQLITLEDGSECTEDYFLSLRDARRLLDKQLTLIERNLHNLPPGYGNNKFRINLIKAFKEGKEIEVKNDFNWIPVKPGSRLWLNDHIYRIKP